MTERGGDGGGWEEGGVERESYGDAGRCGSGPILRVMVIIHVCVYVCTRVEFVRTVCGTEERGSEMSKMAKGAVEAGDETHTQGGEGGPCCPGTAQARRRGRPSSSFTPPPTTLGKRRGEAVREEGHTGHHAARTLETASPSLLSAALLQRDAAHVTCVCVGGRVQEGAGGAERGREGGKEAAALRSHCARRQSLPQQPRAAAGISRFCSPSCHLPPISGSCPSTT